MKTRVDVLVILIALSLVAGCGGESAPATPTSASLFGPSETPTPVEVPSATDVPQPTNTTSPRDTPKPTDTPIPTHTPEPTATPTPSPMSELDLAPLLIQSGDLPAGYSGAQIRDTAPAMFDELPKAVNTVFQELEKGGGRAGGIAVFLFDSGQDVDRAYGFIVSGMTDDAVNTTDVGERGVALALSGVLDISEIAFSECSSVVHVRMTDIADIDAVVAYGKRLARRLEPIVCSYDIPEAVAVVEPTNTPISELTEEPTTEPKPQAMQPVDVLQSSSYIDDSTGWGHIIGVLVNNTGKPLKYVEVVANLFDEEGTFIESESSYALTGLMLPNDVIPFDVLVMDTPEFSRYELAVQFNQADDDDLVETCRDFELRDTEGDASSLGFSISGMLQNNCTLPVKYIEIIGTVFDANGEMIGAGTTYAKLDELAPGQSSPFELTFLDVNPEDAASFELIVEAETIGEPLADEVPALPVEVLQSTSYTSGLNISHIIGLLRNNTEEPFKYVEVVASAYDADGKFVGSATAYAMTDLLLPGDVVPFNISFLDTPEFSGYELALQSDEADEDDLAEVCREFEISDTAASTGFIGYQIIGLVTSACPGTVEYVEIIGTIFNVNGQLIGTGSTYTELDELEPRDSSPFEMMLMDVDANEAASFELIVEAEISD